MSINLNDLPTRYAVYTRAYGVSDVYIVGSSIKQQSHDSIPKSITGLSSEGTIICVDINDGQLYNAPIKDVKLDLEGRVRNRSVMSGFAIHIED